MKTSPVESLWLWWRWSIKSNHLQGSNIYRLSSLPIIYLFLRYCDSQWINKRAISISICKYVCFSTYMYVCMYVCMWVYSVCIYVYWNNGTFFLWHRWIVKQKTRILACQHNQNLHCMHDNPQIVREVARSSYLFCSFRQSTAANSTCDLLVGFRLKIPQPKT